MAASHLVAGLQLAFNGDEDLDHLHDAGAQIIAALQLVDLVFKPFLKFGDIGLEMSLKGFDILHHPVVGNHDLRTLAGGEAVKHLIGDLGAGFKIFRAARGFLIQQQGLEAGQETAFQDRPFVVPVLGQSFYFRPLDGQRAFVLDDAAA